MRWSVYNDYVYFWRWAAWQAVTKREEPGIVALITASSYLDGASLGGLRATSATSSTSCGSSTSEARDHGARVDENVFAIRTPVTIAFGIRTGGPHGVRRRHLAVEGTRDQKLAQLGKLDLLGAPAAAKTATGPARITPA